MIRPHDLRDLVIIPTLERLSSYDRRMYSEAAVNLLLGTAAHESLCGYHLKQTNGPALGIYQIEPATHADVWDSFLRYRPELMNVITLQIRNRGHSDEALVTDLAYATAIARLVYWRSPEPLPDRDDIEGQASYWRRHYNTTEGRGSVAAYLDNANNILDAML